MDPKDLIIVDYPSLFDNEKALLASPPTPNSSIDSIDSGFGTGNNYPIKLNQAWEREVKYRNDVIDWLWEMQRKWEKYSGIGSVIPGFSAKKRVLL